MKMIAELEFQLKVAEMVQNHALRRSLVATDKMVRSWEIVRQLTEELQQAKKAWRHKK